MAGNMWRVLVVEDDLDSLELVAESLKMYRSDVTIQRAMNGEEGLKSIASFNPSLVIVDLSLPGMNGWQLLDAIRRDPKMAALPVVAITGYGSVEVREQALRSGFTGYFPKPLDVTSFGEQVARLGGPG